MKSFSQLSEIHDADTKLDRLGHPVKLNKKRLDQLKGDYSTYADLDFDQWRGFPFPKNR